MSRFRYVLSKFIYLKDIQAQRGGFHAFINFQGVQVPFKIDLSANDEESVDSKLEVVGVYPKYDKTIEIHSTMVAFTSDGKKTVNKNTVAIFFNAENECRSYNLGTIVLMPAMARDGFIIRYFIDIPCKIFAALATQLQEPDVSVLFQNLKISDSYWESMFNKIILGEKDTYSDFAITVGEKTYYCHKVILRQSEVLNQWFQTEGTSESRNHKTDIVEISNEVFEEFLKYLYTGEIDMENYAQKVLYTAEKYQMPTLLHRSEAKMRQKLTITNAVDFLLDADLFKLNSLKNEAIILLAMNKDVIIQTQCWDALLEKQHLITQIVTYDFCTASFFQVVNV